MDIQNRINAGVYENKKPYVTKRTSPEAWDAYQAEESRVMGLFFVDMRAYALEEGVPEKYVEKVIQKAWQDGHSSGLYEVVNELYGLIDLFGASQGRPQ